MKKTVLFFIIILLPATTSAYSFLQPKTTGIRLGQTFNLFLSKEISFEQMNPQPGQESFDNGNKSGKEMPKNLKRRSYWIPILWDLAPVPIIFSLHSYCHGQSTYHQDQCFEKLLIPIFISLPLWTIPPNSYLWPLPEALSISAIKLSILLFAMGMEDTKYFDTNNDDNVHKDQSDYWLVIITLLQAADITQHTIRVLLNNIRYNNELSKKQVYLTPYLHKDRAGLACQVSF